MTYKKKYINPTDFVIIRVEDNGSEKYVIDGVNSPKVKEWLSQGNTFITEKFTYDLAALKTQRIASIKAEAERVLSKTDYKTLRNIEEEKLINSGDKISKTIKSIDYIALLKERKAIRDWSNTQEAKVMAAKDYKELMNINMSIK